MLARLIAYLLALEERREKREERREKRKERREKREEITKKAARDPQID